MKPNIKLKSMPFALASLLCVSSVCATAEHGSQAKDEVPPSKKPLAGTPLHQHVPLVRDRTTTQMRQLRLGPTLANPNAAVPSTGKRQPRLPTWRANAIVTYRANEKLTASVSVRYSSGQFGQLNNSDTNGFAYTGITSYVVADLIAKYKITRQWTAMGGINNVNNDKYWIFHPFPQRTFFAQLKFNY
jgi:outer membrane cobalamin receptor